MSFPRSGPFCFLFLVSPARADLPVVEQAVGVVVLLHEEGHDGQVALGRRVPQRDAPVRRLSGRRGAALNLGEEGSTMEG